LPPIVADRLLLEQGIMNLVLNARDAMLEKGSITVRTTLVEFGSEMPYPQGAIPAGRWVRIEVEDQGRGLTSEAIKHLFEPFFTTKEPGKGTGLGLSASFATLREMEGHLILHSTGAEGTIFHMLVPVADGGSLSPAVVESSPTAGSDQRRVLVVDDERPILDVIRRILTRAGFEVSVAESADAAMPMLEGGEAFDILVTDMMMPGLSGRELATAARARSPQLRVVFISGYTSDEAIRRGQLEVGEAFVQKPFTGDELLRTLRMVLA
jgi:CheY-like chemotaxis protein